MADLHLAGSSKPWHPCTHTHVPGCCFILSVSHWHVTGRLSRPVPLLNWVLWSHVPCSSRLWGSIELLGTRTSLTTFQWEEPYRLKFITQATASLSIITPLLCMVTVGEGCRWAACSSFLLLAGESLKLDGWWPSLSGSEEDRGSGLRSSTYSVSNKNVAQLSTGLLGPDRLDSNPGRLQMCVCICTWTHDWPLYLQAIHSQIELTIDWKCCQLKTVGKRCRIFTYNLFL